MATKEKEKTPTAAEQLAAILKASPKLGLDDLFSKPQLLVRDLVDVPFSIVGAKVGQAVAGENVEFTLDEIPAGHIENIVGEAETVGQLTANNLKIVAYFSQNPKGKITGATFAKQGREYYISKWKAPVAAKPEEALPAK